MCGISRSFIFSQINAGNIEIHNVQSDLNNISLLNLAQIILGVRIFKFAQRRVASRNLKKKSRT